MVGYRGMHYRIVKARGSAKSRPCTLCTKTALDWSFNHTMWNKDNSEDVVEGPVLIRGQIHTLSYSLNPMHYIPMCRGCHRRYDNGVMAAAL